MNLPRFPWKPPSSRQNTRANPMLFPWSLRYVSLNSSYHLVMWHGNGKWAMASTTMTSPGIFFSETLFFSPSIIMNSHESTDNPPLITIPIGSMYAIYGNIYHQYTPNVSIYTSTMDPMGLIIHWFPWRGKIPEAGAHPPAVRWARLKILCTPCSNKRDLAAENGP